MAQFIADQFTQNPNSLLYTGEPLHPDAPVLVKGDLFAVISSTGSVVLDATGNLIFTESSAADSKKVSVAFSAVEGPTIWTKLSTQATQEVIEIVFPDGASDTATSYTTIFLQRKGIREVLDANNFKYLQYLEGAPTGAVRVLDYVSRINADPNRLYDATQKGGSGVAARTLVLTSQEKGKTAEVVVSGVLTASAATYPTPGKPAFMTASYLRRAGILPQTDATADSTVFKVFGCAFRHRISNNNYGEYEQNKSSKGAYGFIDRSLIVVFNNNDAAATALGNALKADGVTPAATAKYIAKTAGDLVFA